MYNIVFGENPLGEVLLAVLGLNTQSVGRYRDAFVSNGEIVVYTRNGGGNRECYLDEDNPTQESDCGRDGCYSCAITHRLPKHPNYLRDQDDTFDSTYATVYFSIPEKVVELIKNKGIDIGDWKPDERWKEALAKLDAMGPQEALDAYPELTQVVKHIGDVLQGQSKGGLVTEHLTVVHPSAYIHTSCNEEFSTQAELDAHMETCSR